MDYMLKVENPPVKVGQYWAMAKRVEALGINRHKLTFNTLGCNPKPQDMTQAQLAAMIAAFAKALKKTAPLPQPEPTIQTSNEAGDCPDSADAPLAATRMSNSPEPDASPARGQFHHGDTEAQSPDESQISNLKFEIQNPPCLSASVVQPPVLHFYSAADIAAVCKCSRKTVHRRAAELNWPREEVGQSFHYLVPAEIAAKISALEDRDINLDNVTGEDLDRPMVTWDDIADDQEACRKVGLRQAAVEMFLSLQSLGKEIAISTTIVRMREQHTWRGQPFYVSAGSLRTWCRAFAKYGVNGLVEQKRGVVGRQGVSVPLHIANLGKALTAEHGSVAKAARILASHPDLPAEMRLFLHGGHCSKTYVTPSIARAINPAMETKRLIQGNRNARLKGRWTPANYDDYSPGDYFVSDDMTDNSIVWCEWPNALGWRIGQLQILPTLDVRSLRWLCVRGIMRDGGQYNAQDDIWGLFGDTFDQYGLPLQGFVLEGGHWQSNAIRGVRTGLDADVRIGGLVSLGLENVRSYLPKSKIIEPMFHIIQHEVDRTAGFTGRDARRDQPELTKKHLALLRVKNPVHHPREFFLHMSQRVNEIQTGMENFNNEPQDGKLLRGLSPIQFCMEHKWERRDIPDSAKWLYRSAMNVSRVTSNGVNVSRGSGPKRLVYYWDNPDVLPAVEGRNVIIHWNDGNPEADAILRDAQTRKFICVAKSVPAISRFHATPEQLAAEGKRKSMHYARTEMRAIQPDLVRATRPIPVDDAAVNLGRQIAAASDRQEQTDKSRQTVKRAVAKVELTDSDRQSALRNPHSAIPQMSPQEIAELLS